MFKTFGKEIKNTFILIVFAAILLNGCFCWETGNDRDHDSSYKSPRGSSSSSTATCRWSEWGNWGNCSSNCGGGAKYRYKNCRCDGETNAQDVSKCKQGNKNYQPMESASCNTQSCCQWTWGNWGNCTEECGGGKQTRSQTCHCSSKNKRDVEHGRYNDNDNYYSTQNTCSGYAKSETRSCNTQTCCQWGNWSDWSDCGQTSTCENFNRRVRHRDCTCTEKPKICPSPSSSNGSPKSYGHYKRSVENDPGFGGNTNSGNSGSTNQNENPNTGSGGTGNEPEPQPELQPEPEPEPEPEPSVQTILEGPSVCSATGQRQFEGAPCEGGNNPPPVENSTCCMWDTWTEWSPCSQPCDGGVRLRYTSCMCPDVSNNMVSVGIENCYHLGDNVEPFEIAECNTIPCDCNWVLPEGGCASACSLDGILNDIVAQCVCGNASEVSNRSFCDNIIPPSCEECDLALTNESCCAFGVWTEWTECTVPCGGGERLRRQFCDCSDNSSCACSEGRFETELCNNQSCCSWSADQYTNFSICSDTPNCGNPSRHAVQLCVCDGEDLNPIESMIRCLHLGPPLILTELCNITIPDDDVDVPVPVDGTCCVWGEWGSWDNCTKNCNNGTHSRKRSCHCGGSLDLVFPNSFCGDENDTESAVCNNHSCCGFENWTEWSSCSSQCGGGWQYRYQTCSCQQETNDTTDGCESEEESASPSKNSNDNDHSSSKNSNDNDHSSSGKSYGRYKRAVSGGKSYSSSNNYNDNDHNNAEPSTDDPTCDSDSEGHSNREEQMCNTEACARRSSSKKYY